MKSLEKALTAIENNFKSDSEKQVLVEGFLKEENDPISCLELVMRVKSQNRPLLGILSLDCVHKNWYLEDYDRMVAHHDLRRVFSSSLLSILNVLFDHQLLGGDFRLLTVSGQERHFSFLEELGFSLERQLNPYGRYLFTFDAASLNQPKTS